MADFAFEKALASLKKMAVDADLAGKKVVTRSQVVFEASAKKQYTEAHKQGTPTPSKAGSAPAVISGTLRRSWVSDSAVSTGVGTWTGKVFPTSVYARIQELGGTTGRGGATTLPARPVIPAAYQRVAPVLSGIHVEEFNKVIGG